MKELAEIKPCPFCGEDAEMKESRYCRPIEGWLSFTIRCKGCGKFAKVGFMERR